MQVVWKYALIKKFLGELNQCFSFIFYGHLLSRLIKERESCFYGSTQHIVSFRIDFVWVVDVSRYNDLWLMVSNFVDEAFSNPNGQHSGYSCV